MIRVGGGQILSTWFIDVPSFDARHQPKPMALLLVMYINAFICINAAIAAVSYECYLYVDCRILLSNFIALIKVDILSNMSLQFCTFQVLS